MTDHGARDAIEVRAGARVATGQGVAGFVHHDMASDALAECRFAGCRVTCGFDCVLGAFATEARRERLPPQQARYCDS